MPQRRQALPLRVAASQDFISAAFLSDSRSHFSMNTAVAGPRSMSRSINFRLIAFLAIIAMPFLWFAYIFIN